MAVLQPSFWTMLAACACTAGCGSNTGVAPSNAVRVGSGVTTLAPPSHDSNTITQLSPESTCPEPANENDYFGQPRCCNTKAAFCEDFESATVGGDPNIHGWSVNRGDGDTLTISDAHAARGQKSLHIHAAGASHSMISTTMGMPFTDNNMWGRAFFYWNSSAYPNNQVSYVAAGPADTLAYQWLRYSSATGGMLGGNDSDPGNSSFGNTSLPTGGWGCLEWHYEPAQHLAHYFLNGQEITSPMAIDAKHDTDGAMNFAHVEIGWELNSADSAVPSDGWDMYIDEIALDGKQIGCAN